MSASSRICLLLFTFQCFQVTCFCTLCRVYSCPSAGESARAELSLPYEKHNSSPCSDRAQFLLSSWEDCMGNIFFEGSSVQKCPYFTWLIVWLGMDSLTIIFPSKLLGTMPLSSRFHYCCCKVRCESLLIFCIWPVFPFWSC